MSQTKRARDEDEKEKEKEKEKEEEEECDSLILCKKRNKSSITQYVWSNSKLMQNSQNRADQKQYKEIYQTIDCSDLTINLKMPTYIVNEITDFAMGVLLPCFGDNCNEKIAFLFSERNIDENGELTMIKCPNPDCGQELYPWFCEFCQDDCTVSDDVGMYCEDCETPSCFAHAIKSSYCNTYLCSSCAVKCSACKSIEKCHD